MNCAKPRLAFWGAIALPLVLVSVPAATAASGADAAADTVRTNLWLVEALMREVAAAAAAELPPPPASVLIAPLDDDEADELMTQVLAEELVAADYAVYYAAGAAPADSGETVLNPPGEGAAYELRFRVLEADLAYPETGRRLGIWREWVARDLRLTVQVSLLEIETGRLVYGDRITRRYRDRVPAGFIDEVGSDLYEFTAAETKESGWRSRLEEVVVLGTLAGLVAVYFANTQ